MDPLYIGWALIIGAVWLFVQKKQILGNKKTDVIVAIVLVGIGLSMTGILSGIMKTSDQSVASGQIKGVTLSAGVNNVTTTEDFYTNGDDTVTFYMADATNGDDGYVNVTVTAVRKDVEKAQSFELSCESPDFTKSGTTYNIVSKGTDSKLEGYVDGAGTPTLTGWSDSVAFTEGDVSNAYVISFKQDEAGQDALTTKESVNIACNIGGFPFNIVAVAND